jgi:hypothetical protein
VDFLGEGEDDFAQAPVVVCDAVESLAVHNGVARLRLSRITADGEMVPAIELLAPTSAVKQILDALQTMLR